MWGRGRLQKASSLYIFFYKLNCMIAYSTLENGPFITRLVDTLSLLIDGLESPEYQRHAAAV